MRRHWQALIGIVLLAAGVLCAYAGSLGAGRRMGWLAEGAALPAGLLFALAVVFLLRAMLTGRARTWTYFGVPAAGGGARLDEPPPSARTLEILAADGDGDTHPAPPAFLNREDPSHRR